MASVAESMDAVASSRTRILFLLSRTLPRQNNWRCPKLQFPPSSLTAKVVRIRLQWLMGCKIIGWKYRTLERIVCRFNDYIFSLKSKTSARDLPEESKRFGSLLMVSFR
jgi:hypothetical protein